MSLAISPSPLLLGLYLLRFSKALFLGSPSPKTEHSSALISDQVPVMGSFSITLFPASPTNDRHQLRLRSAAVILVQSSLIPKLLSQASMVSSSGLYFSNFSIVRQISHRCHHCYVPTLATQVTILLYQAEG